MKPIYLSVKQKETGENIRRLLKTNGYTVKDVQEVMGFENPQAVYKWISGKSLPNLENLLILSKLLNTSVENILVLDEDINILQSINTQWMLLDKWCFGDPKWNTQLSNWISVYRKKTAPKFMWRQTVNPIIINNKYRKRGPHHEKDN